MGKVIPPYSADQRRQALKHALTLLHSDGMTGFKDPDITQDDWVADTYAQALRSNPKHALRLA